MRARCPGATALGTATLAGWRFVINPDGYGSIAPQPGGIVHGVLWRLTARDLAAINAYENVAGGLYVRRMLPVLHDGQARARRSSTSRRGAARGRRAPATSRSWSMRRATGACRSRIFAR